MASVGHKSDDEYSEIGDKGDIGFIDFESCKSVCSYNPAEESEVVTISVPFPLVQGNPQSGLVGETIFYSITIENKTTGPVDLWLVNIYDSKPENSFTLSIMKPPTATSDAQYVQGFLESFSLEDRVLQPGRTLTIWLSCKPKSIGLHTSAVHFTVGDDTIERVVFVMAEDKISQSLASGRAFNRRKKKHSVVVVVSAEPFVVGSRPIRTPNRGFRYRLPTYPIPQQIRNLIEQKQIPDEIKDGLTKENYFSYFQTLLVLEEIKMEVRSTPRRITSPRRFNVAITRARSLLILVGNPHIICKDGYWNKLLWYCSDNNSYKGCFLPGREEVVEEQTVPRGYVNYDGEDNFQSYGDMEWDDNIQPSGDVEWAENLQPPGGMGWGDDFQQSGEVGWGENSFNTEEIPKPVTDEAEWSDGWK